MLTLVTVLADCGRGSEPTRDLVPVVQQMGAWEGTENQTLGLVSQSGRFRIRWQTRLLPGAAHAAFTLTVHSGVSGRPLQEVVRHSGAGEGAVNFEDDPRPFNLMVESTGVHWSIAVDETVMARAAR
jgi:hypothetical protein